VPTKVGSYQSNTAQAW